MSNFSEQLAELMAEDNLTQSALATAMNTSGSKFSLYLSGKSSPTYPFFIALIEFFHCSADFLIGLTEYPKRDVIYRPVQPFGTQLRKILQEKGISQYSLIKSTELSWSILHGWLTNKTLPSLDNILKLIKKLDCSVDYLLGRES